MVTNMRAIGARQQEMREWLLNIGEGKEVTYDNSRQLIMLPREICIEEDSSLVTEIYGAEIDPKDTSIIGKCILCPTNEETHLLNSVVLARLNSGIEVSLLSADRLVCENESEQLAAEAFPIEHVHELMPASMPPHNLKLKVDAVVMLLRNIDPKNGLCNGSRLKVKRIHQAILEVELLTGPHQGSRALLPKIMMREKDLNTPYELERRQFPVRLAYAMTINKAQGQTFDHVGVDLQRPVFAHGQLYVAFSRVKEFNNLKVRVAKNGEQGKHSDGHTYTYNIVNQQILKL